jgi:predicted O-methyltransferase YrrM
MGGTATAKVSPSLKCGQQRIVVKKAFVVVYLISALYIFAYFRTSKSVNYMNAAIRNVTGLLVKNDFIWSLIKPMMKLSEFLAYRREVSVHVPFVDPDKMLFESVIGRSVVKRGPLEGLKYPSFTSFGSSIYPKIIGSYEAEIAPVLKQIIATNYSEILDIGCAEGYYAVGLAMKCPDSKVYAYDTDEQARAFCAEMALLNNVAERVAIGGSCSADTLASFSFSQKGLIFCDCEGYEKQLFTKDNISNLTSCDLLIETHDFIDLTISGYIEDLFKDSHDIQIIRSLDDITKAKTYNFVEGYGMNIVQREKLYHEGRPHIMEWYWLRSKKQ